MSVFPQLPDSNGLDTTPLSTSQAMEATLVSHPPASRKRKESSRLKNNGAWRERKEDVSEVIRLPEISRHSGYTTMLSSACKAFYARPPRRSHWGCGRPDSRVPQQSVMVTLTELSGNVRAGRPHPQWHSRQFPASGS